MSKHVLIAACVVLTALLTSAMPTGASAQSRQGPVIDPGPAPVVEDAPLDVMRTLAIVGGALGAVNLSMYLLAQPTAGLVLQWLAKRAYVVGTAYAGAMTAAWLYDLFSPSRSVPSQRIEELNVDRLAVWAAWSS